MAPSAFDNPAGIGEQRGMPEPLILASASPRRRDLLAQMGVEFVVCASGIPETPAPGETPAEFARRAAEEKAAAVAASCPRSWVLGADTVVVVDEEIFGKPIDAADARLMLSRLSGRVHRVLTGIALVGPDGRRAGSLVVQSEVEFRALARAEIDAYVESGEPLDKAGAYAIQGGAARFVTRVGGSYTNVVGLPTAEVYALLQECGLVGQPVEVPSPHD